MSEEEEEAEELEQEEQSKVEEARERVEDRTKESLDTVDNAVDKVLGDVLDTQNQATVYISLRKIGGGDVEAVASESGLTEATVENTLEDLESHEIVTSDDGDYEAVAPTELVKKAPERFGNVLDELIDRED
ncbi:MAG: hypothetical protein ABEK59_09240 [Halobacteria archaeon]